MDIKLTCIECNRPNAVPYGRGHRICTICSQRELKREAKKRTARRIQTLGGFVFVVLFTWTVCAMANSWNTPDSADHRTQKAMQTRD
jgi:hypothetical protein